MLKINPLTACDFYKTGHRVQYPEGTEYVYSNFTPRSTVRANLLEERYDGKIVFFGLQGFIKWFLIDTWNREFFGRDKQIVVGEYKRRLDNSLGKDSVAVDHIEALWDLGYLPLVIKALPEGSRVNVRVPMFTIANTDPKFFWLVNYLESVISAEVWKACTTATIAYEYRKLFDEFAEKTGSPKEFTIWQGHDFSMRGLSGIADASTSAAGHLLSFAGTDGILAIDYLENYYYANSDLELVGGSVPATEHSVMSMGLKESEIDTFKRLITKVYPSGIVSIVSDTWDFWQVISDYANKLKPIILKRDGKIVFRPDSGDPVKIVCGDPDAEKGSLEYKGAIEVLWEIFGGTVTNEGYKLLDSHVGLIYGDSITLARANAIMHQLEAKGFASGNVVLGIGSYTYQYVTRDTFGFAMKATYGVVNGEGREIFKDPKTDTSGKKSARGLLRVEREKGDFILHDQQSEEGEKSGVLRVVFENGTAKNLTSLSEIRKTLGTF